MKKVLVTGADGQLGKCIRRISEKNSGLQLKFMNAQQLDITDLDEVMGVFAKGAFDFCINSAAYTNVELAEKEPEKAFSINADGVRNIAVAAKKHGVTLIHISTDYVFDGEKHAPYSTTDYPNPINEYGKSKLAGERHIQEILRHYFIVRTSWLYSEHGKNFYTIILEKAKKGEDLFVTDEQRGCPTNANNLAEYILDLISSDAEEFGLHHFTDERPMTWFEFASVILKENNLEKRVRLVRDRNYRTFCRQTQKQCFGNAL